MTADPKKAARAALYVARKMFADGGDVTDNPNFQTWFGDSALHDNGVPRTYYTGTSKDKYFTSFNVGRHGAWFTTDPQEASMYAMENDSQRLVWEGGGYKRTNTASRVIPAYLKASNPYTGDRPQHISNSQNYKKAQSDWFDQLRAAGHDAWVPASMNGSLAVMLKHPTQIKSAIGNNNNFDSKSPHIAKATGGATDDDAFTAYHGTPHEFDQFDPAHIGRGEGAQAYGHGMYFAGNEDIARGYRNRLSENPSQVFFPAGDNDEWGQPIRFHPDELESRSEQAAARALLNTSNYNKGRDRLLYLKKNAERGDAAQAIKMIRRGDIKEATPGYLYHVRINAKPEHFLDWDKPLSEQSHVLDRIDHHIGDPEIVMQRLFGDPSKATGKDFHDALGGNHKPKEIAEKLRQMGIPGIRYLDAGSRGPTGAPTHNYVVFDPKNIDIVKRYAQGGEVYSNHAPRHTMQSPAVAELKHLLTMHRDELRSMKGRTQYAAIDGIMKRISHEHGIAPSNLHDDWMSVYHQTPDAWVAGDHGNVVDRALKMTNRGGYAFGGSPAGLASATGVSINFAPAAGAFTGLPLPGTLNLAPSKATLAAILASRPTTYTGSGKPVELSRYVPPSIAAPTFNASAYNLPDNPLEEGQGGGYGGIRDYGEGGNISHEHGIAPSNLHDEPSNLHDNWMGGGVDHANAGGRIHRADGGEAYKDPESRKMAGWDWRPLGEVQEQLGDLREIPSHVVNFGQFMDETARRAATHGLTPRDLIKAYTITRSSIQRKSSSADKARASGVPIPHDFTGSVRPEGAFGEWLYSPMGRRYLDAAEQGIVDHESIADAANVMKPFGLSTETKALPWAAQNLPQHAKAVSDMVSRAMQRKSSPEEWRHFIGGVHGIGNAKAGFMGSLLGRGDQPTLDARQIVLHTGNPTLEAKNPQRRAGSEAVDRLAARQEAMGLKTPEGMEPYYQHLAHHAVWDKVGDEQTTHQDVINAMRHAATGGAIEDPAHNHPLAQAMAEIGLPMGDSRIHRADGGETYKNLRNPESINTTTPTEPLNAQPTSTPSVKPWESWQPTQYKTYNDLPIINPQDLVGKRVGSLMADLTRAGGHYSGIDSSRLDNPEVMMGGPGYGVLPESQLKKLAWAVQGKGAGTAKLNKNSDYIAVHAMNQDSHLSNASMANSVAKTIQAYLRDNRVPKENLQSLNNLIRNGAKSKEEKGLENFSGLEHPDAPKEIKKMTFEARRKMFQILDTVPAQNLGAPNINKIARATLGQESAGVPYGHAMMLIEVPKGASQALVRLGEESGLPVHPSYDWGIHGRVVGRFAHPVAPEVLHQTWFDAKNEENKTKVTKAGRPPNLRRSFEMALPVTTITQNIADRLPHTPHDIQSSKAAQLALNAFNDRWNDTETPVTNGGVGAAKFSRALRDSDSSSTLTQYSEKNINDMKKTGKFTGYKLKNGEIYFGLKRGTNYAENYGFEHPELTPNETSLVSVVNNEPGAKGIGGAPVVLKAIQHGATALDAYAVPTDKHLNGFLPDFYSHFGFQELGRVPFDPKFVTEHQLADMKHEWRKTGWDESRHGMPSMSIMKWKGSDEDRPDAVRRFIAQGGEGFGIGDNSKNVRSASQPARPGTGPLVGTPSGQHGFSDASGDRGAVRADNVPRPADRFTRTLSAVKKLTPFEIPSLGLDPNEIALAKARGLATGGNVVNRALSVVRQHAPVVPGAVSLAKHLSPGRR